MGELQIVSNWDSPNMTIDQVHPYAVANKFVYIYHFINHLKEKRKEKKRKNPKWLML